MIWELFMTEDSIKRPACETCLLVVCRLGFSQCESLLPAVLAGRSPENPGRGCIGSCQARLKSSLKRPAKFSAVIRPISSKETSRSSAKHLPTSTTYAGSFLFPRYGTGDKYGQSVSINNRPNGTSVATPLRSSAFLKVTMPEKDMNIPKSSSQAFREGFVRGYDQGYRQYVGNGNGRYGNGRYENDDYGNGRYGNGSYNNNAELNRGYQQGIETGASDGQRGQSYDPQRSRHYRNASTQAFREGFVRGYDQGYRQYSNGSNRNSNGGGIADILGSILGRP